MKMLLSVLLTALLFSGLVLVCNVNFVDAQEPTEVGGILYSDTTWTIENSPYTVTDTVQIPQNVTLTIEPGVTVTDSSSDYVMFLLHGTIEAHGTSTNRITFVGGGGNAILFKTEGALSGAFLSLDYCRLTNAFKFWEGYHGYFNLTNSEVTNLGQGGWSTSYSSIYESENPIYIENNTFIGTSGFEVAIMFGMEDRAQNVYIRHNIFKENRGVIVKEHVQPGASPKAVVKYNTFIDVSETALMITSWNTQGNMDATENYWGTTNTSLIESWIEDGYDDIRITCFIDYLPILTEPHPDTPTLPITASFEHSPTVAYAYGEVTFDANASLAEYSQIANYTWDFGDGNVTTTSSPTIKHTYTTPSSYDLSLTVTDEYGFTDSASATIEVNLDDAGPVTSDDYDGLWHNEDINITLTAADGESGVAETFYRINGETTKTVSANGQPLIATEGANNILEYWSVDNVGNEETEKTKTVKVDKTVPSGSIQINEGFATTNVTAVTLTLSADDATSGVAQMRFSNDGTEWGSWETYSTSKAWTLTADNGEKTVYVQFKDNADLVSQSIQDTIMLDTVEPTADAGQDQTVIVNTQVTFDASASSDNLGIVSYEWDFGDVTTGSGETTIHTYTSEGTYTVTLTVRDAAGNADTHQITVTVQANLLFPLVIIGAVAIVVAAVAVFLWKKRKKHS